MKRSELVKKALSKATPAQLIRVRALLGETGATHHYAGRDRTWEIRQRAVKAFDAGNYDDPDVLDCLYDKSLGDALR